MRTVGVPDYGYERLANNINPGLSDRLLLSRVWSACSTTIRSAELAERETSMTTANDSAVRRTLEAAGVEFIDENGGGPGVRLRKRHTNKA